MPSTESEFSPKIQAVMLFGSLSLYFAYKAKVFRNSDYNSLALIFSIICFLWFVSVFVRWLFYSDQTRDKLDELPKMEVPYKIKCAFDNPNCKNGDINIWSIIHFILYVIVGYFVPDYYLTIVFISILCELCEIGLGSTSKLILDPVTNLLGYIVGSAISPYKRPYSVC